MKTHHKLVALLAIVALILMAQAAAFAESNPAPGRQAVIAVKGLACPFCVHGLKKHLSLLPGAKRVEVTLGTGEAVVTFAPTSTVTDAQIRAAVKRAGFTAGEIKWRSASS